ncbi:site-specific DNA-methyltransferase [Rhodospirillum rubrum]|uniref:site-specific DNA-methyltransferase (adenine-specific) n=1 Tax=Rhodospirillum rubrum (strain ATCC 11170 / ATH 1.1.1 / DSM 467 / LMG 4362 / NCIMB 8255 / S1) TaxID=269796 RepID=Q2RXU9_RHORT|nr:site-specific DNA-methyltransferase [Rhodospirillum rubrum]ABC21046.1 DNA methylase N-4/N-6 [Rhodospirillum rubrum ATCC 11170]MBK5952590.1 site-specific DNA-methyltransferase [Rhodospirillum rubrum]QXG80742.1 site-specific DNA-methyltransferase [Rhodospirillum rubrum]HAQ00852.1 site-specific DNA-methyltransferase [Rhodospirillum rubrum]HCF17566.1 site-specific DNA-methyltransferase [Rhodospirillum rubrum]
MAKEIGVETLTHKDAKRVNIPTAELQSVMQEEVKSPIRVAYDRRNRDLDPQLVWRGKDERDWSELIVQAPPLYIQEKIHPKVLIDDLKRESRARAKEMVGATVDLFADFNGLPDKEAATEFYQHHANWTNRMILGDSLSVMASLAEREGLRGKVQCIYFDPPYGIKFNSNFQWSTTSRDVKDGNKDHITREPEQVRAFRDTWRDGIHTYLSYLRDRLTVARDLLTDSGSIFVQIGDENVHRVRMLMDEVFGDENFISQISTKTSGGSTGEYISNVVDFILWYSKSRSYIKFRKLNKSKEIGEAGSEKYTRIRFDNLHSRALTPEERLSTSSVPCDGRVYRQDNMTSQSVGRDKGEGAASWFPVIISGSEIKPSLRVRWKTNQTGMDRLLKAERLELTGNSISYVRFIDDFSGIPLSNSWDDIGGIQSRLDPKVYVVQTPTTVIQRCILMASDPGDLVLDPTCGSGSTAFVAEQWGRRWITIDTSRVSLALARARIMGARYPYYLLADSRDGQVKEGQVTRTLPKDTPTHGDIRQGFVYERVPHVMLSNIASNSEIDVIWDKAQETLEPLRTQLNAALDKTWHDWEIPREADKGWSAAAKALHAQWWDARIRRQKEIDASIAAKAEFEYLYDKPYEDKAKVRVAGPFTVESLSPHRVLAVDQNDELVDLLQAAEGKGASKSLDASDFAQMVLDNLKSAGVQQAHKEDRIAFTALTGWPGKFICAKGVFREGDKDRSAGIVIGPEFGTVSRLDLVTAAREAGDAGFDVLIACAFNFDAHSAEFDKLGAIRILKARMNPDLHMGGDLKSTGAGNLFVVFGEPDIDIIITADDKVRVKIKGVDIFHPSTGEIESGGPDTIAVWFIDTDYNEESFFVRHAYFLGADDPYKALKTTLKAEIDREAWDSLNRDISRPFDKPKSGRIAVKVINHLGDEVMKVFSVDV